MTQDVALPVIGRQWPPPRKCNAIGPLHLGHQLALGVWAAVWPRPGARVDTTRKETHGG